MHLSSDNVGKINNVVIFKTTDKGGISVVRKPYQNLQLFQWHPVKCQKPRWQPVKKTSNARHCDSLPKAKTKRFRAINNQKKIIGLIETCRTIKRWKKHENLKNHSPLRSIPITPYVWEKSQFLHTRKLNEHTDTITGKERFCFLLI